MFGVKITSIITPSKNIKLRRMLFLCIYNLIFLYARIDASFYLVHMIILASLLNKKLTEHVGRSCKNGYKLRACSGGLRSLAALQERTRAASNG
jgi:hypothetical protein